MHGKLALESVEYAAVTYLCYSSSSPAHRVKILPTTSMSVSPRTTLVLNISFQKWGHSYLQYLEEIGDKNYTVRSTSCLWNESCPCATLSPPIGGVVQLGPVDVDRCDERPCDRIWDHWTQWSTCSSERYVSRAHNCSYSIRCRRRKCLMVWLCPVLLHV